MSPGPGEPVVHRTSIWLTVRTARARAVRRLCGDDVARAAAVVRLMERLRRNERPPGALKRAAWRLERALGSPLRRGGLWPDA